MLSRRKVLLALLEKYENLTGAELHRLLASLAQLQSNPSYEFVHLPSGPHSFTLAFDLDILEREGKIARQKSSWIKTDPENYFGLLKKEERKSIEALLRGEQSHGFSDLNSAETVNQCAGAQVPAGTPVLFTIGYEGKSLEAYLGLLMDCQVKVLCDVRRNAFSMKWGFSKHQLQSACEKVGIMYVHIPELGIESEDRKNAALHEARGKLFSDYRKLTLPARRDHMERVIELLEAHGRVALTCFEADHCDCHRGILSEELRKLSEMFASIHL